MNARYGYVMLLLAAGMGAAKRKKTPLKRRE